MFKALLNQNNKKSKGKYQLMNCIIIPKFLSKSANMSEIEYSKSNIFDFIAKFTKFSETISCYPKGKDYC